MSRGRRGCGRGSYIVVGYSRGKLLAACHQRRCRKNTDMQGTSVCAQGQQCISCYRTAILKEQMQEEGGDLVIATAFSPTSPGCCSSDFRMGDNSGRVGKDLRTGGVLL